MDKKERIVLAFLFVISCIYSFVMPEGSIEKIENVPEITIFIEGAVNTKLSYDHDPTISEIFKDIHIENSYGFDENYCLSSQDVFYIPAGEQLISLNSATKEELMTIKGIGPVANLRNYQMDVAAYTKGMGRFSCELDGYYPCQRLRVGAQNE